MIMNIVLQTQHILKIHDTFETYLTDEEARDIVDKEEFARLNAHSSNLIEHIKLIPNNVRETLLSYIKNNIEIERFA
ncbi:MAG: hypothetical protein CM15mP96_1230 [Gammaproteobacteria bacterium]|nr:MAG: hypothetical protein CM15mP96_1230 [Gammaproteobacteria bacterium]